MTDPSKWGSREIAMHARSVDLGYVETADGAPITAHHIPCDPYDQDFEGGTLARVHERPNLWRRILRRIFG